ncbi:peptidoglycan-binding protein [Streptomyces sp. NPDC059740]|uniref:peptidoglycan-binding domain-containing protein n=1 Tax=Streptomyces sp. NPDC059740 TaxID=3346926 RepID=UPI00364F5B0D
MDAADATDGTVGGPHPERSRPPSHRRRRRRAVVAGMTVAAAALGVAGVMVGSELVSEAYHRDEAPDQARTEEASPTLAPVQPTDGRPPSLRPSTSPSPTPPAAPTHRSAQTTAPAAATVSAPHGHRPPATATASGSVAPTPSPTRSTPPATTAPVLSEGDSGAEVAELQYRLAQAGFPAGDGGVYDERVRQAVSDYQHHYGVQGDPDGVYGAHTRRSLESRTSA